MLKVMRPLLGSIMLESILLMSLPGCGTRPSAYPGASTVPTANYPSASESPDLASGFGIVEAIDMVPQQSSGGIGLARTQSGQMYRISFRMDNGAVQTLLQESAPVLRIGERVRISSGIIERM